MDNGTLLIFLFLGLFLIGGLIQYFLWKSRKKDKEEINKDWEKFLHASSNNNIGDIKRYGDRLIWNQYLNQKQLTKIKEVVDDKIEKYQELEELKLNAFNKQLRLERVFMETRSS